VLWIIKKRSAWIPGTTGQREENCATIQTKNKTQQFKQTKPQLRPTSHKKHCSICPNRPTEPQHTRCNRNRPVTARVRKFQTTIALFIIKGEKNISRDKAKCQKPKSQEHGSSSHPPSLMMMSFSSGGNAMKKLENPHRGSRASRITRLPRTEPSCSHMTPSPSSLSRLRRLHASAPAS